MTLSGVVCPVMSVKFISSNNIALLYKMAGISGMFIDMEHFTLQLREMAQLILVCNYVVVSPIVGSHPGHSGTSARILIRGPPVWASCTSSPWKRSVGSCKLASSHLLSTWLHEHAALVKLTDRAYDNSERSLELANYAFPDD